MTALSMTRHPDALWLNPSPALKPLHAPLLQYLRQSYTLAQWDYSQSPDEPSSLEIALTLLHDYLKSRDRPIHLIGHSTGGLLAWLYTQRYPQRVRSLTLLAVGIFPAVDWQAHYYMMRQLLPIDREQLLRHMTKLLFGQQPCHKIKSLISILDRDLTESLSPHSLLEPIHLPSVHQLPVPLFVCGGEQDLVVDPTQIDRWYSHLKPEDHLWSCPQGRHFFHATCPLLTADQILNFWHRSSRSVSPQSVETNQYRKYQAYYESMQDPVDTKSIINSFE